MDNTFAKEELISLHDLGEKIADEMEMDTPEHEDIGVSPIEIHKTNGEHKKGMMAIYKDIYENLMEKREE